MQDYDIRRGHFGNIEGDKLENLMKSIFIDVKKNEDGSLETKFGALSKLKVWIKGKNILAVDTEMDPGVDNSTAQETIKKYNMFLESATGFTSKERSKRLQKKAKEGKL